MYYVSTHRIIKLQMHDDVTHRRATVGLPATSCMHIHADLTCTVAHSTKC
jgi:hypothetical protein